MQRKLGKNLHRKAEPKEQSIVEATYRMLSEEIEDDLI
jgi:hypothetical protein